MRNLNPSDIPQLGSILRETGAFNTAEVECALELLQIVIEDPKQQDYYVTVAENEGKVAGYILYGPVPLTRGTYDIYWIATDPGLHGKGWGKRLLCHTESQLADCGARMICLETSSQETYHRTRRFYENAGYIEESRIRDFYRHGDDRITYVKRLANGKGA